MPGRIVVGPNVPMKIKQRTVGEFFFEMADFNSRKVCQIDYKSGTEETFASVKQRSIRTALELKTRGVTPKDTVVFCSHNFLDSCIPVIATTYLGATFSSLDPTLSVRDIKHLLNIIKPKFLFVDDESLDSIENSLDNADFQTTIVVFDGDSTKYLSFNEFLKSSKDEETFKPTIVDSNATAAILFSSGTTGLPKAIRLSHINLFHLINDSANYGGRTSNGATLNFTTLYWLSAVGMLLSSFAIGTKRVLIKNFDIKTTFEAIAKYKIIIVYSSPLIANKLMNSEYATEYDLSSLFYLFIGGGKISPNTIRELQKNFKNAMICITFGTTESGLITAFGRSLHEVKLNEHKIESSGKVVSQTTVKVVDPETEEILGPNQKGEIRCKSPGVMLGYIDIDPKQIFDDDGYYKTGDIGYYDDDEFFYIVDRIKEAFKYLSYHIIPTAIEMVLLEHPAIAEACVFGVPIPACEDNGEYPAACVVLKPNRTAHVDEIIDFVSERVIDRERLRGGVKIVDTITITPTGKIMRRLVREQYINCLNKK